MRKAAIATNVEKSSKLNGKKHARTIWRMKKTGAPLRQIVRLSGVNVALVQKTLKN